MKQYRILMTFMILLTISCKKNDTAVVFTGRIVHANDSSAHSNSEFIMYATQETTNSVREATEKFYTNSDGYFRIEFVPKSRLVSICYPDLVTHVPDAEIGRATGFGSSYDFGTLYTKR